MRSHRSTIRRRILAGLAGTAMLLGAATFYASSNSATYGYSDRLGHAVFPNIASALNGAKIIRVKAADLYRTGQRP